MKTDPNIKYGKKYTETKQKLMSKCLIDVQYIESDSITYHIDKKIESVNFKQFVEEFKQILKTTSLDNFFAIYRVKNFDLLVENLKENSTDSSNNINKQLLSKLFSDDRYESYFTQGIYNEVFRDWMKDTLKFDNNHIIPTATDETQEQHYARILGDSIYQYYGGD